MLFNSRDFLIFFTFVFAAYWLIPWQRVRVYLLLAASFYFYASWSEYLALLVAATSVADYFIARAIDSSARPALRKLLLLGSFAMNLGLLATFKYANFFLESLRSSLQLAGGEASLPYLEFILPLGISFYTFEAISYTVDVYQKRIAAERNLAYFMLFILFFPHLVAGPIVRARDFLPQIARPKRFSWVRVQHGGQLFLLGLFKKMAIADRMAVFSNPVFEAPQHYHTLAVWLALFAYGIRIYCDFSGYSDMAIGSAQMLGYRLNINFRTPYLALNISDFWRRWHISLSSWLRDYVYIPLGGSHGTAWKTSRNLLITMAIAGLWHGASWSYILWGALHGFFLVAHRAFRTVADRWPGMACVLDSVPGRMCRAVTTFSCVTLTWVFFQPSLQGALLMLEQLFTIHGGSRLSLPRQSLFALAIVLIAVDLLASLGFARLICRRAPAPVVGFAYAVVLALTLMFTPDQTQPFIYFQF